MAASVCRVGSAVGKALAQNRNVSTDLGFFRTLRHLFGYVLIIQFVEKAPQSGFSTLEDQERNG